MNEHDLLQSMTRRMFFKQIGYGIGGVALSNMLAQSLMAASETGGLHFAPKAKRVICLFMSGGMSQLESFDYKPELLKRQGQPLPDSIFKGRKPLGMSKLQSNFFAHGSPFPFQQHGQSGAWMSDRYPHLAKQADHLTFLKGMVSEAINHDPAIILMNSGDQFPGRPVMGSWLSYGLGSENQDLPAYVVMVTKKFVDQPLSSRLWDSGFLPSQHQGVTLRPGKEAVLFLNNPNGLPNQLQRKMLDRLKEVHLDELSRRGEADIESRIEQYEMAFRMQSAVPETLSIKDETPAALDRYGPDARTPGTFAHNCVMARRLSQSGVRFVQLFHPGWDQHGNLKKGYEGLAQETDQPIAALLEDLRERGMMQDTLVLCMTEFGRTCYSQGTSVKNAEDYGREHHRDAFTFWVAGAGIKPGMTHGLTDDFGFDVVDGKVTVNDFHATVLHLLGINHERFTYPFQGRDYRLTDVAGKLVQPILA
jgi:hypothetical protein